MPIDILSEDVITLDEAAKLIPGRDGGTAHPFTVASWTRAGRRGVVLESLLCGPRRCTSKQALQRFFDRIEAVGTPRYKSTQQIIARERTQRQQAAAARKACRDLEAAGA
jgi:Protein of unknown function (DUF1580)